jgi:hypothetical protein
MSVPQQQCRRLVLSILHLDHGLLHDLKHLSLHRQHLLKSWWGWWRRIGTIVVLGVVVLSIVVIPCVGHLKYGS